MRTLGAAILFGLEVLIRFVLYIAVFVIAGGIVGSILFPLVGVIIGYQATVMDMGWYGLRDIAFWAGLWGFGFALAGVTRDIYRKRLRVQR